MKNLLHKKKNENSKFIVQSSNAIVFISAKRWSCCIQNEFLKQVFSTPVTNKKKEKNWNMEIMNNLGNKHTSLTSELVFFCVPLESSRSDINRDYYYVRTYSAAFLFPENQNKSHTLVEIAFIGNFPRVLFECTRIENQHAKPISVALASLYWQYHLTHSESMQKHFPLIDFRRWYATLFGARKRRIRISIFLPFSLFDLTSNADGLFIIFS